MELEELVKLFHREELEEEIIPWPTPTPGARLDLTHPEDDWRKCWSWDDTELEPGLSHLRTISPLGGTNILRWVSDLKSLKIR